MTLFQARYIQWLTLNGCSLRATAGHYYTRYNEDGSNRLDRSPYEGHGGNQIAGIILRKEAIAVLHSHGVKPYMYVSGCDDEIGYEPGAYDAWRKKVKDREGWMDLLERACKKIEEESKPRLSHFEKRGFGGKHIWALVDQSGNDVLYCGDAFKQRIDDILMRRDDE